MRTKTWIALATLGLALLLAAPAGALSGHGEAPPAAQTPGPLLALQPCVRPVRYDRCYAKCEWSRRKYEESGNCYIDIAPGARSTCRAREVKTIRGCVNRCKADFCPQFNP